MPAIGKFTPSRFKEAMTNNRAGTAPGETALKLCYEVLLDRIGVERPEIFAPALDWGHEWEGVARTRYEEKNFASIELFYEPITHPEYSYIAGTPDGKITGQNGIIEIKCPYNSHNHLMNILIGEQVDLYMYQMQGYMMLTNTEFCDFVSFDPRFPAPTQLHVQRILRDDSLIKKIVERLKTLEAIVCEIAQKVELIKY
jgi:predicted phage-related endonuclease